MPRRPEVMPQFATNAGPLQVVEPNEITRKEGFKKEERPPAAWMNWMLYFLSKWTDFLRGPRVADGQRSALAYGVARIAADLDTPERSAVARRIVGITQVTATKVYASRRGNSWVELNVAVASGTVGTPFAIVWTGARWIIGTKGGGTGRVLWTWPSTTLNVAGSALDDDTKQWTDSTLPGGTADIEALAVKPGGVEVIACTTNAILYSTTNGTTFAAITIGGGGAIGGQPCDAIWTGAAWVAVTMTGEIFRCATAAGSWTEVGPIGSGSHSWRLETDGNGFVIAYPQEASAPVTGYYSDNDGLTWNSFAFPALYQDVRRIRHVDGAWFLASLSAPYLAATNDPTDDAAWLRIPSPYVEGSSSSLEDIVYSEGALVAVGSGFALVSGRAADTAPAPFVPSEDPPALRDAGTIRGVPVSGDVPADGETLVYNGTTLQWEPGFIETIRFGASGAGANFPTDPEALNVGGAQLNVNAEVGQIGLHVEAAGTIDRLRGDILVHESGKAMTFTLWKNGVATALTGATPGAVGTAHESATDNTHAVAVAPGDFIQLQVSGAAAAIHTGISGSVRYRRT